MSEDESKGSNPLTVINAVAPAGLKKKLMQIARQLGLGTQKGAELYAKGRENLDQIENRSLINKALAEAVALQVASDPALVERAKARLIGDLIAEQGNIEAVVIGSAEHIDDTTSNTGGNDNSSESTESMEALLDLDWAATFIKQAKGASSEDVRDRLSRVLAGEVNQPGSYPRSVLRTISELEKSDIEAMRIIAPYMLRNKFFTKYLYQSQSSFDVILQLFEAGLVSGTSDTNFMTVKYKNHRESGFSCVIPGNRKVLILKSDAENEVVVPYISLTKAGLAVVNLLNIYDEVEVFKNIAPLFKVSGFRASIGNLVSEEGSQITYNSAIQIIPEMPKFDITSKFNRFQ